MVGGFASERKNALNGQCQISIGMFAVWFIIKFVNIVITFPKCIQNAVLCCRQMMVLRTHYLHVFHIPKGNFCDNFVSFVPLVNRKKILIEKSMAKLMMCLECFQSIHSVQVYLLDHLHAWITLLPWSKAPCSALDTISKNIHTYKIDVNSNKHGKKVAKTGSSKYVSFIHENNNSFPFSPHHRTCYFHGL